MKITRKVAIAMSVSAMGALWGQNPSSSQFRDKNEKLEVEVVTLSRDGLSPAKISKKGPFILVIEDETGTLDGLALQVEDDKKAPKEKVDMPGKGKHGASILRLTNGMYKIKLPKHELTVEVKP